MIITSSFSPQPLRTSCKLSIMNEECEAHFQCLSLSPQARPRQYLKPNQKPLSSHIPLQDQNSKSVYTTPPFETLKPQQRGWHSTCLIRFIRPWAGCLDDKHCNLSGACAHISSRLLSHGDFQLVDIPMPLTSRSAVLLIPTPKTILNHTVS